MTLAHFLPDDCALAFERCIASAQSEVLITTPELAPDQQLLAPPLRDRGLNTWSDLLTWVSRRGVALKLLYAEPDPVFEAEAHRAVWRQASVVAQTLDGPAQVLCAPHPYRAGAFWQLRLRRILRQGMAGLEQGTSSLQTLPQRNALQHGPVLRPHRRTSAYALVDGKTALIGQLPLAAQNTAAHADGLDMVFEITDSDFCGALRPQFSALWSAATETGAPALAAPLTQVEITTHPQSRAVLRLLRTEPAPGSSGFHLAAQPQRTDSLDMLKRHLARAKSFVFIETNAWRDAEMTDALCAAGRAQQGLNLVVQTHPARDVLSLAGNAGLRQRSKSLWASQLARMAQTFGDRMTLRPGAGVPADPAVAGLGHLVIIDGLRSLIGSSALTPSGLRQNSGIGVLFEDPDLAEKLLTARAEALGVATDEDLTKATTWTMPGTELSTDSAARSGGPRWQDQIL